MDWIGPAIGTLVAQLLAALAVWISWRRLKGKGIAPEQLRLDQIRGETVNAQQGQINVLIRQVAQLEADFKTCKARLQEVEDENKRFRDLYFDETIGRYDLKPRRIAKAPVGE